MTEKNIDKLNIFFKTLFIKFMIYLEFLIYYLAHGVHQNMSMKNYKHIKSNFYVGVKDFLILFGFE